VDVSLITFLFLLLQFIVVAVTINCIEFVVLLLMQQMGQEALFSGCPSVFVLASMRAYVHLGESIFQLACHRLLVFFSTMPRD